MKAWLRDLWSAALLRSEVFARLSARSDAFLRGFLVVVVVALIAGLPALVTDMVKGTRADEAADFVVDRSGLRESLQQALPMLDGLGLSAADREQILEQIMQNLDLGLRIGAETAALPTLLPEPIGAVFNAVGGWLSRPFADGGFPLAAAALGTWLGYGVWVMLAAKLLGGRGALHSFFGATALFAIPHVLGIFGRVPVVGPILGFVAFAWGIAIYVKATSVSQQFSVARSLLAVAAPLLLIIAVTALLAPMVLSLFALLLVAAG